MSLLLQYLPKIASVPIMIYVFFPDIIAGLAFAAIAFAMIPTLKG